MSLAGETAEDAIAVFDKAVAAHGVPQRLLTDNGRALNPSRRGIIGQLVAHVAALGRRGDHRQALQADHPGQERTLPPDPVPLPRQAAAGRDAGRAPGPGRRVRPHLQHPAPPPRATRADHAADRLGGDPQGRTAPPEARPARLPAAGPGQRAPDRSRPQTYPPTPASGQISSVGTINVDKVFYKIDVDRALRAGPRRQRRQPDRRQDHHHRPPRRDPRRTHPARTRHPLRRQRPTTADHAPRNREPSPKS